MLRLRRPPIVVALLVLAVLFAWVGVALFSAHRSAREVAVGEDLWIEVGASGPADLIVIPVGLGYPETAMGWRQFGWVFELRSRSKAHEPIRLVVSQTLGGLRSRSVSRVGDPSQ